MIIIIVIVILLIINYKEALTFFSILFIFASSVTRVPVQSTQPPPGIVELDGEKFTLQW